MTTNEMKLIRDIYDFLLETNFDLLKKNIIEIENNHLELPFKVILKNKKFTKKISDSIKFLCVSGTPLGMFGIKAEKDEEKKELLKQKKEFKKNINLVLQETKDNDVKKILEIFLTSL